MGRRLNYKEEIKESVVELEELEKSQHLALYRDRVRYIRHLKSGISRSQKAASASLGISDRQGQRNWRLYKTLGLKGLLAPLNRPGAPSKLNQEELEELEDRLKEGDVQFLHETATYIKKEYGQDYTVSGIHYVFKRLGIKKKTGRPTNIRQDKEGLESFKKTLKT